MRAATAAAEADAEAEAAAAAEARRAAEPDVLEEALEHLVKGIVEHPDDVQVGSRGAAPRAACSRCACTPTTSARSSAAAAAPPTRCAP